MSCPTAVSFLVNLNANCSQYHSKESTMTKSQLKEIRQIMQAEYRQAIACKRLFSPIWYLFV
jgi:hypothetical protein